MGLFLNDVKIFKTTVFISHMQHISRYHLQTQNLFVILNNIFESEEI